MIDKDLEILEKHVSQIASLVLAKYGVDDFSISVSRKNEFSTFELEEWKGEIICFITLPQQDNFSEVSASLFKLLGKTIYTYNNENIYWFEGDNTSIVENEENKITNTVQADCNQVDKLKTDTRLPRWLDRLIFDELSGKYAPDFNRYASNIQYNKSEAEIYLGTYFPRSFGESFCIVNDLIKNHLFVESLSSKQEITILDIGSGTGGNLIGALQAFKTNLKRKVNFKIVVIDGNAMSLEYLEKIINTFMVESSFLIEFEAVQKDIKTISEINEVFENISVKQFDWILSSKMICELIAEKQIENAYQELLEISMPKLSDKGLMLLLDVTTKPNQVYLPILLNKQANSFLQKNKEYLTLTPLCCNRHGQECFYECFCQQIFRVTHREKKQDISKVAYRIIGRKEYVEKIIGKNRIGKQIIQWTLQNNKYIPVQNCIFTENYEEMFDSYKLQG